MKVIAIAAQLGSGKDTVADYLAKRLNEKIWYAEDRWHRIGFAHAVKKVFMDTFRVSWSFIEEWKRKDEPPPGFDMSVRKSLQFIGDGFRQIKSNIWIETAFRDDRNLIISDGRYINEAKAIKEHGGLVVIVHRPGYENNDPNPSESQIKPIVDWCVQNAQEGPLQGDHVKNFDFFLKNDGTIEQLYNKIDNVLIPFIENNYDRRKIQRN